MRVQLAPSILAADFARLGQEMDAVAKAGAHVIHVDVMDGQFVPNITIGPPVVKSLAAATALPLDCHLMIANADRYIDDFVEKGATSITVHAEACTHLDRTLDYIRQCTAKNPHFAGQRVHAGVALNPSTPPSVIEHVLDLADLVLVMTVNPGFGGQRFIGYTVKKIEVLRSWIADRQLKTRIQVDGGIGMDTLETVLKAGATSLVAGSAVFGKGDPGPRVGELLARIQGLGYHLDSSE